MFLINFIFYYIFYDETEQKKIYNLKDNLIITFFMFLIHFNNLIIIFFDSVINLRYNGNDFC